MGQQPIANFTPGYVRGNTSDGTSQEYDSLIYDITIDQRVKGVTLASGQGVLARGTVLGISAVGSITSAAKSGGNTGGGSIGSLGISTPNALTGIYKIICTAIGTPAVFSVTNPASTVIGSATAGVAYSNGIMFTVTASGTAFAVGDEFDITVPAGNGLAKIVVAANSDGSQYADCILSDSVDTTNGSVATEAYVSGSFNRQALIFGSTDTYATVVAGDGKYHEQHLRGLGIFLSDKIVYNQNPNT